MDEKLMHEGCEECAKRKEAHEKSEEDGMQILVALMPLLTITFLSNFGLF